MHVIPGLSEDRLFGLNWSGARRPPSPASDRRSRSEDASPPDVHTTDPQHKLHTDTPELNHRESAPTPHFQPHRPPPPHPAPPGPPPSSAPPRLFTPPTFPSFSADSSLTDGPFPNPPPLPQTPACARSQLVSRGVPLEDNCYFRRNFPDPFLTVSTPPKVRTFPGKAILRS